MEPEIEASLKRVVTDGELREEDKALFMTPKPINRLYASKCVLTMTRTELQKTGGKVPYVLLSASLIEEGFKWKKGQKIQVDYNEIKKQVIVTEQNGEIERDVRRLQNSSGNSTPYIYLSKSIIGTVFKWDAGQQLNVEHDVKSKRVIISELNGETVNDGKK
ncbi:MAG: hypothetical protein OI715_01035 (plasmid) [Candidatus Methanoperedens sp.]|nr:MAG: hypothetical protein OI715_01035 [Candidatus Methanoperedens sp.]